MLPCVPQQNTKKIKSIRKKYSSKRTEFQVRKRTQTAAQKMICENINIQNSTDEYLKAQVLPTATMFYPPCPQYYPIPNEWSPVIPIQCPLYTLPIPIIVNPVLSTDMSPYTSIVIPQVTVPSEFPVSPLVSGGEFSLQMSGVLPIVTAIPNESAPVYCDMSPTVADLSGFTNLALYNEVTSTDTPLTGLSPYVTELSNEIPPAETHMPNKFSPLTSYASYEFSPVSEVFSPIQNIQVPNEFIPICSVSNEILPLSMSSHESFFYGYFECEPPIIDEKVYETYVLENGQHEHVENSLEYYLSLPKNLFPTAWMMTIDPNSIIEEFCKAPELNDYSWILDLEFGIPKAPVTRRVATYNVKLNSVNCKNVPEAIHPGFESCDKDLKRALMFYYDCVISNWYRGYISLSSDKSVENFQSWLLLPMQALGMCWP